MKNSKQESPKTVKNEDENDENKKYIGLFLLPLSSKRCRQKNKLQEKTATKNKQTKQTPVKIKMLSH